MEYNIEQFLENNGYKPVYRRAGYGMYISPLRDEKDASFKVDYNKNLWYDFGIGVGGGFKDLCKRLNVEVKSELMSSNFHKINNLYHENPLQIISQSIIHSTSLISYLEQRMIPLQVARAYCTELAIQNAGKQHLVIGFRNDLGGWEMRNRYLKISSSPKTVSSIQMTDNNICSLFEGFMDFLSMSVLSRSQGVYGSVVVLNSVSNIQKALPSLVGYTDIRCYFDNDKAGKNAFDVLRGNLTHCNVEDCSVYYSQYKDLNDCLTGKMIPASVEKVKEWNHIHVKL